MTVYLDDEPLHRHRPHRTGDDEQMMRILRQIVVIVGLATCLLTVGYNWRRVDEIIENQTKSDSQHDLFMRKDVANEQYQSLSRQIAEVKALVEVSGRR